MTLSDFVSHNRHNTIPLCSSLRSLGFPQESQGSVIVLAFAMPGDECENPVDSREIALKVQFLDSGSPTLRFHGTPKSITCRSGVPKT